MSPIEMSKLETSIRTVLAFHEARNRVDQAGMLALLNEDCSLECPGPAPEGEPGFWQACHNAILAGFLPGRHPDGN